MRDIHGLVGNGCLFFSEESRCKIFENTQCAPRTQTATRRMYHGMGCEICRWSTIVSGPIIVQITQVHEEYFKTVAAKLDPEHGPLESFMSGPPLVGIFEVDEVKFLEQFKQGEDS